jgi:uncharacterized protein YndB with AHSA1/START domain
MRVDQASRTIHAPPSAVYRAFETAAAMESWLPPKGMTGQMLVFDFREGGFYRMRLTYGEAAHRPGKSSENSDEVDVRFVRLIEDRLIEQGVTFNSENPDFSGVMKVTWTFQPVPGGSDVTVRCENVPPGIRAEDHQAGLTSTLQNLAEFTEPPTA